MTNTNSQTLVTLLACSLGGAAFGVEHATLDVTQRNTTNNNQANANPALIVNPGLGGTSGFSVVGHNKGDIDVSFSSDRATDRTRGILITSVAEIGRNNGLAPNVGGPSGISYGVSSSEPSTSGFYIPTHTTLGGSQSVDQEFNVDVSGAYFPHAEGWLAGHFKAATTLYSSPALRLGREFINAGDGTSLVDLRHLRSHGVPATSQNGVLLVCGGDNAANFAMARTNADGTFTISSKNNSNTAATYNNVGAAFAYVPVAAAGMGQVKAVGRIRSDGGKALEGGAFTVTKLGTGRWLLQIEGVRIEDGTLIVSATGGMAPAGANPVPKNINNYVAYGWSDADDGWVVESRDSFGATLEDGATPDEEMFSFMFLTPGEEPVFAFENPPLPDIALSSPTQDSYQKVDEPITLSAAVDTPENVEIAKVEFYVDGVLAGTATTAPFEVQSTVTTIGTHLVEAFAYTTEDAVAGASRVSFFATVSVGAAGVPGYSTAILDGGDLETDVTELDPDGVPSPTTPWSMSANTAAPLAFDSAGDVRGAPVVNINGAPVPFNSGILFGTNYLGNTYPDIATRGSIDNNVIAFESGGYYALKVEDNKQGGGNPVVRPESGRFSLGFFPFANGWVGATVATDLSFVGGNSSLPEGVTITKSGTSDYLIEGLPMTGNLLAVSQGEGSDNVASVGRSSNRWLVRSVDNNGNTEDDSFSFVYVPPTTPQILSGLIADDGTLTPLNETMAAHGATVLRTGIGYEIQFGDGSRINPSNTTLLLSADLNNGNGADNIYAYHTRGNKFVVFSHDLPGITGGFQSGGFRFLAMPTAPVADPGQQVVVTPSADTADEGLAGNDTLRFRLSRLGGDLSQPLTASYTVSGTATPGTDFESLPGSVTFPAGVTEMEVPVVTLVDEEFEVRESVILTLGGGSGFSVGSGSATGIIRNVVYQPSVQTASFQQGVNGYGGYFGKRVGNDGTNQLESAVQTYGLDGRDSGTSPDINGISRFDGLFGNGPGQIPFGSTILKAELVLTTATTTDAQSSGPWVVDRLKYAVQTGTLYEHMTEGSNLGARGRSKLTPVAGFGNLAQGDVSSADVTKFVRIWATEQNPENENYNHGFSIYDASTGDAWAYCTSGNTNPQLRPKLVVSYLAPGTEAKSYSFVANKSARLLGMNATMDGSTLGANYIDLDPGATQEGLFQFPVEFGAGALSIPSNEQIVRAELVLTTFSGGNSPSTGPIAVHRMLEDWTVESNFGFYGPEVGLNVDVAENARVTGLGHGSLATFDVTNIVQAWRGGHGNYGISLKPETTDGWQFFWPGSTGADAANVPKLVIYTAKSIGGGSGFEDWASANGIGGATQDFDGDDHDGIPALIEYALGLNPKAFDKLPGLQAEGGGTVLRFLKDASDNRLVYKIKSSIDLDVWDDVTATVDDANEISAIIPIGEGRLRFYRLSVTYLED